MSKRNGFVRAALAPLSGLPLRVRGLIVVTMMIVLLPQPLVAAFGRAFSYSVGGTVRERYAEWFAAFRIAVRCLLTGRQQ